MASFQLTKKALLIALASTTIAANANALDLLGTSVTIIPRLDVGKAVYDLNITPINESAEGLADLMSIDSVGYEDFTLGATFALSDLPNWYFDFKYRDSFKSVDLVGAAALAGSGTELNDASRDSTGFTVGYAIPDTEFSVFATYQEANANVVKRSADDLVGSAISVKTSGPAIGANWTRAFGEELDHSIGFSAGLAYNKIKMDGIISVTEGNNRQVVLFGGSDQSKSGMGISLGSTYSYYVSESMKINASFESYLTNYGTLDTRFFEFNSLVNGVPDVNPVTSSATEEFAKFKETTYSFRIGATYTF